MAKAKKLTTLATATTAQALGSLIKSARDIMRKDKGLSSDLDRLPVLTWVMFLKFLDDLEFQRQEEAKLRGSKFRTSIDPPYRWRDWAAKADGITGDDLKNFINADECVRPDGSKGPGLFAYLRGLTSSNGDNRRDVIATVFKGVDNRVRSGYILRDVINKVSGIHFTSSEELHTLGALYETMLREMRDAAGDNGEFYTPRPVVRFMVKVMDPRLGETVLDPACGTGGFLVESFNHLSEQVKTVADRRRLQNESLLGCEAKPLPYLLCQMNLLLHGLDAPQIDSGNALRLKLTEIGEKDRVDVILTNPPFGGEEEKGIQGNFPEDRQTSETALLFLQLIARKLRRPVAGRYPGRAAVILPDGVLSQEGVAARVRADIVEKYNLHTVVRLPRGVFEPYTRSSTSILFFDTGTQSPHVWYYELKLRTGIKAYTAHQMFEFEEWAPCLSWWYEREENESAWKVSRDTIAKSDFSLNFRNPRTASDHRYPAPDTITKSVNEAIQKMSQLVEKVSSGWSMVSRMSSAGKWPSEPFDNLMKQVERPQPVSDHDQYKVLAMSWYAKGMYVKHTKSGTEIKADKLYRVQREDFVYNRLFAWKGSFAVATAENDGCYVSNEFPCFTVIDKEKILPEYLWAYFAQPAIWDYIEGLSTGTTSTSRLRLKESRLAQFVIPLPPVPIQKVLATMWHTSLTLELQLAELSERFAELVPAILERSVPVETSTVQVAHGGGRSRSKQPLLPALGDNSFCEDETDTH